MTSLQLKDYEIADGAAIPTPALLVYPDRVDHNIRAVIAQCGGEPGRWRPHVKTAKIGDVMAQFVANGVTRFKCATSKELRTLLELEAPDVLVAFPMVGANAARVRALAAAHPKTRVSVLVESTEHLAPYRGSGIGVFVDCNPGMDRTGRDPANPAGVAALVDTIVDCGCTFRGVHWYDGHMHGLEMDERTRVAHAGYDALLRLVAQLATRGHAPKEIVVAGTPASPCALSYTRWSETGADVEISPGTVVYNDATSLTQLPESWGLKPAALVLATVVSHPRGARFTCDAGHKTVSADAGVPTCTVVGHAAWTPSKPSEEHLPIDVPANERAPSIGATVLLLPRHICPTVNNFDEALFVRDGRVERTVAVTARGR
ncbi:MAG TPA: alanine racemase [Gemmatimonadaceae bacterium]|nr:alanine racemase [Gemmatimonadaceae bacterium]